MAFGWSDKIRSDGNGHVNFGFLEKSLNQEMLRSKSWWHMKLRYLSTNKVHTKLFEWYQKSGYDHIICSKHNRESKNGRLWGFDTGFLITTTIEEKWYIPQMSTISTKCLSEISPDIDICREMKNVFYTWIQNAVKCAKQHLTAVRLG